MSDYSKIDRSIRAVNRKTGKTNEANTKRLKRNANEVSGYLKRGEGARLSNQPESSGKDPSDYVGNIRAIGRSVGAVQKKRSSKVKK